MDKPTISVVTPCFNGMPYLERTIESISDCRKSVNLEYIVIDGGSSDGSIDCIKANKDKIDAWISEQDQGMYHAIAKGMSLANGEILAWLNSDDLYYPWTIPMVVEIFNQMPEVEWLTTLTPTSIDMSGYPIFLGHFPGFSREAFLDGVYVGFGGFGNPLSIGFIQQEGTFWRRSLWERVHAESVIKNYRYAGDFALWCLFFAVAELYGVQGPLGMFRVHSAQLSSENAVGYMEEVYVSLNTMRQHLRYNKIADGINAGEIYDGNYIGRTNLSEGTGEWSNFKRPFTVISNPEEKKLIANHLIG